MFVRLNICWPRRLAGHFFLIKLVFQLKETRNEQTEAGDGPFLSCTLSFTFYKFCVYDTLVGPQLQVKSDCT